MPMINRLRSHNEEYIFISLIRENGITRGLKLFSCLKREYRRMALPTFRCSRGIVMWWGVEMFRIGCSGKWIQRSIIFMLSGPYSTVNRCL